MKKIIIILVYIIVFFIFKHYGIDYGLVYKNIVLFFLFVGFGLNIGFSLTRKNILVSALSLVIGSAVSIYVPHTLGMIPANFNMIIFLFYGYLLMGGGLFTYFILFNKRKPV